MTKLQIRKAAQIYAAIVVYTAMDSGAWADSCTEDENFQLQECVKKESQRLLKFYRLPEEFLGIGTLDDIITLVKQL